MKISKLRSRLRRIRAQGEERAEEGGELNLVPYLDIVTNVIMFLLATTVFAAGLGDIRVASAAGFVDEPQSRGLELTVSISERGFTIATAHSVGPFIAKRDGAYDYDALAARLDEIKRSPEGRSERRAVVNANPGIPYEVVVGVLDACRGTREERFGEVSLSAGIN
ncbi:MAG TPA: biopolymer transporter ExbD [Polyangia bacterium]|nr:biopolymer transporter ExbD [Polyangia bacterium]